MMGGSLGVSMAGGGGGGGGTFTGGGSGAAGENSGPFSYCSVGERCQRDGLHAIGCAIEVGASAATCIYLGECVVSNAWSALLEETARVRTFIIIIFVIIIVFIVIAFAVVIIVIVIGWLTGQRVLLVASIVLA